MIQVQVSRASPWSGGTQCDRFRWWSPGDPTEAYAPRPLTPCVTQRSRSSPSRVDIGGGLLRPLPDEARKPTCILRDWCKTSQKGQHRQAGRSTCSTPCLWSVKASWQHSRARGQPDQSCWSWRWLCTHRDSHLFARLRYYNISILCKALLCFNPIVVPTLFNLWKFENWQSLYFF